MLGTHHLAEDLILIIVAGVARVDHERIVGGHNALHQHCHAHIIKVETDLHGAIHSNSQFLAGHCRVIQPEPFDRL